MTVDDFRRIALSMPEAAEGSHMGHPDFRAGGRIFATVCYPDSHWGMVGLTPEQQNEFVSTWPESFHPVKGGWGRRGSTNVRLDTVKEDQLRAAISSAWRKATETKSARRAPQRSKSARRQ